MKSLFYYDAKTPTKVVGLKRNGYLTFIERERLKKEIIDEVLKKITIRLKNDNALKEIDELNEAIKNLGNPKERR